MTITEAKITAESYHEYNGIHYVKVSFEGMYISGITVQKSKKYMGWWVQMPAYKDRMGKWKKYIEYANDSELKAMIEAKAIEAIEQPVANTPSNTNVVIDPTDEELDNPLKNIPF